MSGLSFLSKIKVEANAPVTATRAVSTSSNTPAEGADLRIKKNGGVYPSAAMVAALNLQYAVKDAPKGAKGNGFDVFSSKDFLNTQNSEGVCVFIALVPKDLPKVDLFGSCGYDAEGQPTADVLTQGAMTAGKEILELVEKAYGVTLDEETGFMDLKIVRDAPFTTEDGIYYVPKTIARGERKGQKDLVRRENLTLYALVPMSMLEGSEDETTVDLTVDGAPEPMEEAETAPKGKAKKELTIAELEADDDIPNDVPSADGLVEEDPSFTITDEGETL